MNLEISKILENTGVGVLYLDLNYIIHYFTDIVANLTSITKNDIGKNIATIGSLNHTVFLEDLERVVKERVKIEREVERNTGETWLVTVSPYILDDYQCGGIVVTFFDITQGKLAEHQLDIERVKYRTIAELTECGLWEYNPYTKELTQSRRINKSHTNKDTKVLDYRKTTLEGNEIFPEDIPIFHQYCDSMDNGDDYFEYELRAMCDNDEYMWLQFQGSAVKDENGKVLCVVGKTINIDEQKKDRQNLIARSQLDSLTQIYNKGTTKEKIEKCFERSGKNDKHALFIIDLDNFKHINDKWGHLYGDLILEGFAGQLKKILGATDVIGRIGGDEFVVLLKDVKQYNDIIRVAQEIRSISSNGFPGMKRKKHFSVSIGVAIYSIDGYAYDELFEKADIALYAAKDSGKDVYLVYNERMSHGGTVGETTRKNPVILSGKNNSIISSPFTNKRLVDYAVEVSSNNKQVINVLRNVFSEIGKYYDLARIYVIEKDANAKEGALYYEWCNEGVSPGAKMLEKVALQDSSSRGSRLKDQGYIQFCDTTKTISAGAEFQYDNFEKLGIYALIAYALYDGTEYIGSVGFGKGVHINEWKKEELDTLKAVTKIIEGSILRARSETKLTKEEFYMQAILNNQNMINYVVEPKTHKIVYFSEYTTQKFPDLKLGDICYSAIMGRDTPCETCPIRGLNKENKRYSVESYDERLNAWYSATATSVTEPNGTLLHLICRTDVTNFLERVNANDILTGVMTLPKFEAEAMKLLAHGGHKNYAIICFDIDKFKYINDKYGYEDGDAILKIFAELVKKVLTRDEIFCRASADNFILLKAYQDKEEIAERINYLFKKSQMYLKRKFPSLSIVIVSGVYMLTPKDKILSVAIDRANVAKKTVKGFHKSSFAIYDENLHTLTTKEKVIEQQMVSALVDREFVVYLQPKVELATGNIVGAEALVRWNQSTGAMIPPSDFIPTFEKNGFVSELDFYVYEEVFRKIREWRNQGRKSLIISMNVSRVHLGDSKFMDKLDALVKKYHIDTSHIELELTESIIFNNWERFNIFTNQLRERGFLISIDDFGSGFSSLNLLAKLPVDILKIDKDFFLDNVMQKRNMAVISSIIQLAKGLSLTVISEGVETREQMDFLTKTGCDMAQGYLFYRPVSMDEFEKIWVG